MYSIKPAAATIQRLSKQSFIEHIPDIRMPSHRVCVVFPAFFLNIKMGKIRIDIIQYAEC